MGSTISVTTIHWPWPCFFILLINRRYHGNAFRRFELIDAERPNILPVLIRHVMTTISLGNGCIISPIFRRIILVQGNTADWIFPKKNAGNSLLGTNISPQQGTFEDDVPGESIYIHHLDIHCRVSYILIYHRSSPMCLLPGPPQKDKNMTLEPCWYWSLGWTSLIQDFPIAMDYPPWN